MATSYESLLAAAVASRDVYLVNLLLAQDYACPLQGAIILSMDAPRTATHKPGGVYVPVVLSRPSRCLPETLALVLADYHSLEHNNNILAFVMDPGNSTKLLGAHVYLPL